jgi:hypothetical protein
MNERIKELANKAGYSKDYLEIGLPSNMEKFAELIVQECMSNLYLNGYDDAMMQIKQHFGVK